jgi:hypothetical protein
MFRGLQDMKGNWQQHSQVLRSIKNAYPQQIGKKHTQQQNTQQKHNMNEQQK